MGGGNKFPKRNRRQRINKSTGSNHSSAASSDDHDYASISDGESDLASLSPSPVFDHNPQDKPEPQHGATPMYKPDTNTESNTNTQASPAAAETSATKSLSAQLGELEHSMADYIYRGKGLTVAAQTNFSFTAARKTKYDMLDATAKSNLDLYAQYEKALIETNANDGGSRAALLKQIETIYQQTSYTGNRFPAAFKNMLKLYGAGLAQDHDLAAQFVADAKARHAYTSAPETGADAKAIAAYIEKGPRNALTTGVTKTIKEYHPQEVVTDKTHSQYGRPVRIDAMLNYRLIRLHQNMQQPKIHNHTILHDLHCSLKTLLALRNHVGAENGFKQFEKKVTDAQVSLTNYGNAEHAGKLVDILITTTELCESLTKDINKLVASEAPFDTDLAKSYLGMVSEYANSQRVQDRVTSTAQTLEAQSQKKMLRA